VPWPVRGTDRYGKTERERSGEARARSFRAESGPYVLCVKSTYRGGEDPEVRLGHDDGARGEAGGGARAELHLSVDRVKGGLEESAH
jgi:hypothetical protein